MNYRDSKPYLKVHTILAENEIAGLPVVSQERFEEIIDMLYLLPSPDYKHIPNIIRLPPLQSSLAEALGIVNDNFFLKTNMAHIRPQRKSRYGQNLRIEEMKDLLRFITSARIAYVDISTGHQNFILAELDKSDATKTNKIVFNSDTLGNYVVTISKIETSKLQMKNYVKVGAGVAPAIRRS